MAANRARRSVRSDNIDAMLTKVVKRFGRRPWTSPGLRDNDIAITRGIIAFLHISGYIRKGERSVRPYPNAPLCPTWIITEKGMRRAAAAIPVGAA